MRANEPRCVEKVLWRKPARPRAGRARQMRAINNVDIKIDQDETASLAQEIERVANNRGEAVRAHIARAHHMDARVLRFLVRARGVGEWRKPDLRDAIASEAVIEQGLDRIAVVEPTICVAQIEMRVERENAETGEARIEAVRDRARDGVVAADDGEEAPGPRQRQHAFLDRREGGGWIEKLEIEIARVMDAHGREVRLRFEIIDAEPRQRLAKHARAEIAAPGRQRFFRQRRAKERDRRARIGRQEVGERRPGFTLGWHGSARAPYGASVYRVRIREARPMWDSIWINARLATMVGARYGAIPDGAIAAKDGRIAWVGARADLPGAPEALARDVHDVGRAWITPGLIDCHTHLVFAGDRAREYEQRLEGATYEEIARAGGGIASTVAATRAASADDLFAQATRRLKALMASGVTTIEIKSGYGLDWETEARLLAVARRLGGTHKVRVRTTFLALHALAPEFKHDRAAYVRLVAEEMIPRVAREGLADAVDAFCESIAFTKDEVGAVFKAARAAGLPTKLHAEQLSDCGGAALAAHYGALSADHLEYVSDEGIAALARAGTIAVLLPGAFYTLRETRAPPVEKLRAAGVPMALASDCNPGTSPIASLLTVLNMGCTLFRLTPEEALAGVTTHAARALGLQDEIGALEVGKAADFALWRIDAPAELSYWVGADLLEERVCAGRPATA